MKLAKRMQRKLVDWTNYVVRAAQRQCGRRLPIYFCLNSGRCGSASLIRLLQANQLSNCYHEKKPDLLREGLMFHARELSSRQIERRIAATRRGVFFEANNRLFSLAHPIKQAFPYARFLFLHRDGREVVRSGMQRRWFHTDDPFSASRFGATQGESPFVQCCRYWAGVNQRLVEDLSDYPEDTLRVSFEGLVDGSDVERLAAYIDIELKYCQTFPVMNRTTTFSISPHADWPAEWRQQFNDICGPMMNRLGYPRAPRTEPEIAAAVLGHSGE